MDNLQIQSLWFYKFQFGPYDPLHTPPTHIIFLEIGSIMVFLFDTPYGP